ncbi:MAG: arginine--tRNA ligase [Firmicutes bacterium]|nr:arginine--tRNA ligase [Clostridiales bacterium]MDD6763918.1 arginine--tRNA ligase [Bacillota bacterium]MDD6979110.1 arginine--tRNA ligase [Bacillota bacterium]MDD7130264.1 arginine--tRNA ligase [Bacillota bacterium]MDY6174247.1 arginine--tRNA ligase [Lentihominibacter sp.]
MINYVDRIADLIAPQVEGLEKEEIRSMIETPADSKMGDYAFPCFKLAKILRKAPPMIAKGIAEAIGDDAMFEKVEQVNAYVNMFLKKDAFAKEVVSEVVAAGDDYGKCSLGEGKTVIVEYSSPNIAKPFHIGHIRSTVIGASIAKIYDNLGFKVVRINHLGDYGTQFGKMIVAYRRWGNKQDVIDAPIKTLLSYYTKFHVEAENDPTLEDEARATFTKLENGEPEEQALWQWFRDESLKEFSRVYDMLGITYDSYAGESFYSDKMPRFVKELEEKGLLEEDNGAQLVRLDDYGLTPALITKSDGSTLYITRDIAAAVYRKETYDFYKNIYVVASQQNLHFQQWIQILELMGYDWARSCIHVPFGLVSLEDGTMSTREGRVVFLEDVLNGAVDKTREIIKEKNPDADAETVEDIAKAVGIGAVVFNELSNYRIKDYVFSWEHVLNFEGETGPYVQYTHARACSILRNAGDDIVAKAKAGFDAKYLTGESAHELSRLLYELPEVIVEAGEKYEPSIVTRHIVDIAQAFNKFYHDEHILVDNEDEKIAKVAMVLAAKSAIRNGLDLLCMKAPEKM